MGIRIPIRLNHRFLTLSCSSRRFRATPAPSVGPVWRLARSCGWSGRSDSGSMRRLFVGRGWIIGNIWIGKSPIIGTICCSGWAHLDFGTFPDLRLKATPASVSSGAIRLFLVPRPVGFPNQSLSRTRSGCYECRRPTKFAVSILRPRLELWRLRRQGNWAIPIQSTCKASVLEIAFSIHQ